MSTTTDRLRPPPAERFAGPEHRFDFGALLGALRSEAHAAHDGHRQVAVLHDEHLRLILYAFDQGGSLRQHQAPGTVIIHALRGTVRVRTAMDVHDLSAGSALVLSPDVPHDVEALDSADMLLTVALDTPASG